MRTPVGHAVTQVHISVPSSAETVQKRHLSTAPVSSLTTRAWYGQAAMQYLQPMQRPWSTHTMPSSVV